MSDDQKTIEHRHFEQRRNVPRIDQASRREPFFGSGAFPFMVAIVLVVLFAIYIKPPMGRWLDAALCNHLDLCQSTPLSYQPSMATKNKILDLTVFNSAVDRRAVRPVD